MHEEKLIFITGATGYVGCHLAHELLKQGHRIIALVRDSVEGLSPAERVTQAITAVDEEAELPFERLVTIPGDVQDTAAVLIEKVRARVEAPIDEVWHCVATFKFRESEKEQIEATNIEGVRHILEFVRDVNAGRRPRYFHVSTAYSSGKHFDPVPEEITHTNTEFRTLYEWSKHEGEALVNRYQQECGLDATIFRPAIIVGSETTNVISYSAYYQVCEALYRLLKRLEDKLGEAFDRTLDIRLVGDPDTRVNFVPIDFVTQAMLLIAQKPELVRPTLKVFNVVNEEPPNLRLIHKIACESLDIRGLQFVQHDAFEEEPMNAMERVLAKRIAFQAPYMYTEIHFSTDRFRRHVSREELPPPKVDGPFLAAINEIFFDSLEEMRENGR